MMVAPNFHQVLAARMQSLRPDRQLQVPAAVPAPASSPPPAEEPEEYTLAQAAKKLNVSIPTLKRLGIPMFKRGQIVRINRAVLKEFIASHTQAAQDGGKNDLAGN